MIGWEKHRRNQNIMEEDDDGCFDSLMSHRNIRRFTDRRISDTDLLTILKAGMSGQTVPIPKTDLFLL